MTVVDRFWAKVEKTDGCWLWRASRSKEDGYGIVTDRGRKILAHRFSWELHNGPIPDGLLVCHTCDVKPCVNPAHLWLGTYSENTKDAFNKGLVPTCSRKTHCKRGHPLSGDNLAINSEGSRLCRECRRMLGRRNDTAYRQRKRAAIDSAMSQSPHDKGSTD